MTCAPKVKTPGSTLDYGFDWADGYLEMGSPPETLVESNWSIRPAQGSPAEIEMVAGSDAIDATGTRTEASFDGGVLGNRYELVNEIVTSLGRRDFRSIEIRIANQ